MTNTPLTLDGVFLRKISLNSINFGKPRAESPLGFDYEVRRHNDDQSKCAIMLRVFSKKISDPEHSYYEFDFEIIGFFTIAGNLNHNDKEYTIHVNTNTILYGILRGQVSMISGCAPLGGIMLPAIMMEEVVAMVEAERRSKASTSRDASKSASKPGGLGKKLRHAKLKG